jgi:hypothetical protein
VTLQPEGPQVDSLAPDVAAALDARPEARVFFESLATFYRRGYLRWVDATTRRPDVRAARIVEMVELLAAGHKQRSSQPAKQLGRTSWARGRRSLRQAAPSPIGPPPPTAPPPSSPCSSCCGAKWGLYIPSWHS